MSDPRDFGELFAHDLVRHSCELASTMWGVWTCVMDKELEADFPASTPPAMVELFQAVLSSRPVVDELRLHLAPLFSATPDWTGPRWVKAHEGIRFLVTPTGLSAGVTYLLCVPFVIFEEREKEEYGALVSLVDKLRNPIARQGVDMVPVLPQLSRRKMQTHMSTLGRELDRLLIRVTRRAGDLPRQAQRGQAGFLGEGAAAQKVIRSMKSAAADSTPLLVTGEVGSGKGSLVRAMHRLGPRRMQPLVEFDCLSTPATELTRRILGDDWNFGQQTQLEAMAGTGTVVLREVGYLPPHLQLVMLDFLDRWERPDGPEFRFVATSSLNLKALEMSRFLRPEFTSLLAANVLDIPPLRQRRDDIPLIATDMLSQLRARSGDYPGTFSADVVRAVQAYSWPGNLWELKGEVRSMANRARGRGEVNIGDVSSRILATTKTTSDEGERRWTTMPEAVESLERSMILEALGATRWNRSRTAKLLGVSRRNLIRKIDRFQLDRRKRGATGPRDPQEEKDDDEKKSDE